ncbi:hypothetical protein SH668x_000034 [Planctomicrobium sp. SH668]|uniref:hypothetical protein n=1 Tax=Planctomicrobium sp. SH668 TaxID=3448126 RepID=UPI003F5C60D4
MNSPIDQIIDELRSQLQPMEEQESRLRSDLKEITDQKQKLEAALVALGGGPSKARPAKRGKPCVTKAEVTAITAGIVRENGPITSSDLESLVRERITEEGERNLSGFSLRFRETLHEPQFRCTADGLVSILTAGLRQESVQ